MKVTAKPTDRAAGSENQPLELPNESPSQPIHWQSMLAQGDVDEYVYWRLSKNDSMEVVHSSANIDSFQSRSSELAEFAIRTGQSQSCILASPTLSILLAAPIPAIAGDCLCVMFHCERSELNEKAIAWRFAVLANIAAAITPSFTPISPTLTQSSSPPAELPSWTELTLLIKRKLLFMFAQCKSKAKVYLGALLAFVIVGLLPWPHSIQGKVICEPLHRRYVAAPFDSRLLRSFVVVGQQVRKGELLATLDGGELSSQLASVRATLAQAEQRELAALSSGDHSKSGLERLEVEHLRREAELLERRQASLEIRSPIDGVVVIGDLERAEGAPLTVGDNLFEIASLDQLIAEIAVPEQDITFVKNDMRVSIVVDAVPGSRLESTLQRIHLRNEIRDNASVFIAEAELPNNDHLLRPGMNAQASIDAGYRAIGWQLFRRPYNAARQWIGW